MFTFLLWCIMFVLCWPLALLALIAYPFIWLLLLPFRIVGVAVQGGHVALVNMGSTALRAAAVEAALAGGASSAEAAAHAAEGTSAASDIRATREYREHLARVLVSRALTEASSRS